MRRIGRLVRWLAVTLALVVAVIVGLRAVQALRDPALAPWHVFVPEEATAEAIEEMDWAAWIAQEDAVFEAVRVNVSEALPPELQTPENRYFPGSPIYPPHFAVDWNRSFVLEPDGPPKGAVVLAHGLTDAPFSLRHIAELYRGLGFVAIAPRMPGHGTTPGGLGAAVWPEWMAATRLAVREAVRRVGPDAPLHLVGYSNGGALVTKYAVEALGDDGLAQPDRLVLFSPMIGVTRFARFAGVAGWPALAPGFVRAAWFDLTPEFNPFKYNSFPVQAAVQSYRLTRALQTELDAATRAGKIEGMPPVLAFQSVIDATVSARAVVDGLFARLPANGSELVLADINRAAQLSAVIRRAADAEIGRIVPPAPRDYMLTVVTNAGPADYAAVARVEPAGGAEPQVVPLGQAYPREIYSLSHVSTPFPLTDGLYGLTPDPADDFGVRIGTLAARGESGVLSVSSDMFARLYSNPFFDVMAERIKTVAAGP